MTDICPYVHEGIEPQFRVSLDSLLMQPRLVSALYCAQRPLSSRHRRERLRREQQQVYWTGGQWRVVLVTDKTRFSLQTELRQLALEILGEIPSDAVKIYTDGSGLGNQAGIGVFIEKSEQNYSICLRNPDFTSVFRSELIAIEQGIDAIINESDFGDLWILSDSRSSLQHLHNWTKVGDKTSISILLKLQLISKHHDVHLQWIPSHVDIFGNEQADRLAKEGCSHLASSSSALTFSEHQSKIKSHLSKKWRIPFLIIGMWPRNRALHLFI
nr:uncharacterized protein LOC122269492 [Parasteatoda tepidariorum]